MANKIVITLVGVLYNLINGICVIELLIKNLMVSWFLVLNCIFMKIIINILIRILETRIFIDIENISFEANLVT